MSASGYALPPFIIFEKSFPSGPYARLRQRNSISRHRDIELCRKWIDKLFVPSTQHIKKPILLILDGHGTHMDIDMIDFLAQHDIHLYCLPPHTTNILQPLDVAIFKPLKAYFSKLTDFVTLASLGERDKVRICKKNFTAIFNQAYTEKMNVALIQKDFRKCDIYPFNPDAIDKKRLMPSDSYNASVSSVAKNVTLGVDHNIENDIDMNVTGCSRHPTLPGASNSVMTAISPSLNHIPHSSMPQATKSKNTLLSVIPASLVDSLIIPKTSEKKERNIRVVSKAHVLTSGEHRKLFREKVEKMRSEEEAKAKRKEERERKQAEKARVAENKKETREASKKRRTKRKKMPIVEESETEEEDSVVEETEEEIIESSSESSDDSTFNVKTLPEDLKKRDENIDWILCDICGYWFHDVCIGASVKELKEDQIFFVRNVNNMLW